VKKLNINITKAQLKSYTVELKEGKPVVNATVELLTEGGTPVTTYSVYTDGWNDANKFELPMAAILPIVELAKLLENAVVTKCRDSQLALGSGIVDTDPIKEDDFVALIEDSDDFANPATRDRDIIVIDQDDKPIDLSEIPF
jgi:hypothetical protein